jgi:hypothetical protein
MFIGRWVVHAQYECSSIYRVKRLWCQRRKDLIKHVCVLMSSTLSGEIINNLPKFHYSHLESSYQLVSEQWRPKRTVLKNWNPSFWSLKPAWIKLRQNDKWPAQQSKAYQALWLSLWSILPSPTTRARRRLNPTQNGVSSVFRWRAHYMARQSNTIFSIPIDENQKVTLVAFIWKEKPISGGNGWSVSTKRKIDLLLGTYSSEICLLGLGQQNMKSLMRPFHTSHKTVLWGTTKRNSRSWLIGWLDGPRRCW